MTLPPELLQSTITPGGGKITLIVGAGCSFEAPTSIPLSGTCSQECHDRLVSDGILKTGDCVTPSDLSCLADTIHFKTGRQQPLVDQLCSFYPLKSATPNDGYLLAAALLRENIISSVVTFNYDLALSIAIATLGVGDVVGIIESPEDLPHQKAINVYYIHRNVNASDPEKWILRSGSISTDWKTGWEGVVAAKVLASPIIIFAGLGTPINVIIESTRLIQQKIKNGIKAYQVDPSDHNTLFATALNIDPSHIIKATWCEFMDSLSQRIVEDHIIKLKTSSNEIVRRENLPLEDLTSILNHIKDMGLVNFGRLRANWLLQKTPYCHDEPTLREPLADLLLAAAMLERLENTTAIPFEDGIVEFHRGNRIIATYLFVSGQGTRSCNVIECELSANKRKYRGRRIAPTGAIISGTRDNSSIPVTTPQDTIRGDTTDSIIYEPSNLKIYHVETLRQNNTISKEMLP